MTESVKVEGGHIHISIDWSGEAVRPEVIPQVDASHSYDDPPLQLVDICFGRDPENRPDDGTLHLPDGYPDSIGIRLTRRDAVRLKKALAKVIR